MPLIPTGPDHQHHETFQNINGAYKLYDRLELTTTTGTINIEIDPQPGDKPAQLLLSTDTGSIRVRLSSAYLHRRHRAARAIDTNIRSLTGTVNAEILLGHGGNASVDTSTGAQVLSVLTSGIGRHDEVSELKTYSKTGSQRLTLTSLHPESELLTNLRAEHHSFVTAQLDIVYPRVWLGKVHATASLPGHLAVSGSDLEYVKQGTSEITAYRGPVKNRQTVDVVSHGTGNANFQC